MSQTYIAILPDNKTIQKFSLEEILILPFRKFILREDRQYVYNLINASGDIIKLIDGKFEVVDMNDIYYGKRRVRIMDKDSMEIKMFTLKLLVYQFFTVELLPLLQELNELGTFTLYARFKSLKRRSTS